MKYMYVGSNRQLFKPQTAIIKNYSIVKMETLYHVKDNMENNLEI